MPSSSSSSGFSSRGGDLFGVEDKACQIGLLPWWGDGESNACSLLVSETKGAGDGLRSPASPLRLRRARAAHRRADDARSTTTSTTRRTWTRRTPLSRGPTGQTESVEQILSIIETLPEDKQTAVRNNAGGHANHSLFWEIMSPDGGGEPEGELADAINDTFGSLDELKKAVNDAGVNRFGSGWTWLVYDGTGLAVYSTANQDSPILQSDEPLLGNDVWEHAYYLKYQNRRPDYLEAWWNVVNWPAVAERYAKAIGKVRAAT